MVVKRIFFFALIHFKTHSKIKLLQNCEFSLIESEKKKAKHLNTFRKRLSRIPDIHSHSYTFYSQHLYTDTHIYIL